MKRLILSVAISIFLPIVLAGCAQPPHPVSPTSSSIVGDDPGVGYWVGLTDANGQGVTMAGGLVPTAQRTAPDDPCTSPTAVLKSASIAIAAATTTEIVAAVAAKTVTLCSCLIQDTGAATSLQWETGTKAVTACDTGAAVLSGALLNESGRIPNLGNQQTQVVGALAGELCAVSVGAAVDLRGYCTYTQQ